jgi:hypothetical protein
MSSTSRKLSGLQKEVLGLYRSLLREAFKKDQASTAAASNTTIPSFSHLLAAENNSVSYARTEFRRQAQQVKRSDFKTIEYKMRKGQKQIKLLQMPGVKVVGGTTTTTSS